VAQQTKDAGHHIGTLNFGNLSKAARRPWNRRQSDPDAYHLVVQAYDKALRAAKRTSWRTFCGEVDDIIPSARLHWVFSKDVSYQMGALRLLSGDFTSSDEEATKHLPNRSIEEHHSLGCVLQEPT
jgi:hypothetical protein